MNRPWNPFTRQQVAPAGIVTTVPQVMGLHHSYQGPHPILRIEVLTCDVTVGLTGTCDPLTPGLCGNRCRTSRTLCVFGQQGVARILSSAVVEAMMRPSLSIWPRLPRPQRGQPRHTDHGDLFR